MKIVLLFSLVIIIALKVQAQTPVVQDLPELQEWYSWPGALNSHISYLPNFANGVNAVTQYRKGEPTWFNQFPYDTTNQFSWKEGGSKVVVQVDFNNDGISEYFDTGGRIYTSSSKGLPPNPEPIARVSVGGSGVSLVEDINGDGFPDLLLPRSPVENSIGLDIVYGGIDLTKLRVAQPIGSNPLGSYIAMYSNENKGLRLITYRTSDFTEGFYLYEIKISGSPSDSIIVGLIELDKIEVIKEKKSDHIFEPYVYSFYKSKILKKYAFFLNRYHGAIEGYDIQNDHFGNALSAPYAIETYSALDGSIDGDDIEDFITGGGIKKNNITTDVYFVLSGLPLYDYYPPKAYFLRQSCGAYDDVKYIGDVTGDGIGDVAYGSNGCFTIYKGVDWQKLSAQGETSTVDFTLHQTEPSPIGIDGKAVLPITITHSGVYTLEVYDLSGKRLGELFKGELPSGEVRLPIDVKMLSISAGMYELRLSDGKHSREHAFVIGR